MSLPYKIATLLYCFNEQDEVLLIERAQAPNLGLWSPPGGKLRQETGESPHVCAAREAAEELGGSFVPSHFQLTGIVSEHGYYGEAHWLMFLFELTQPLAELPPPIREGRFGFFSRECIDELPVPRTDREGIWPLFWKHRRGFFVAHCRCAAEGSFVWEVEQSSIQHRYE